MKAFRGLRSTATPPRGSWPRREFLARAAGCGLFLAGGGAVPALSAAPKIGAADPLSELLQNAPRARYWDGVPSPEQARDCAACHAGEPVADTHAHRPRFVRCRLCARNCVIPPGERGMCRARLNSGGELRSLVYGRPITIHVDPIEKKPFYHFLPGSAAFSLATSGCPLRCKFCQNWEISQSRPEDYTSPILGPERVVRAAVDRSAPVIAFTYNEPTVFTEYLTDVARAARPLARRSVLVSCGFMNEAPLVEMCQVLDAIKIDLKGFSEDFYRDVCGAELRPVLRSIRQIARSRVHLEIVNLVVPTLNDSPEMLVELSKWVAGEVGPDVPVHFTRFHPDYQMPNLPPTPVATLERAREFALRHGVRYAYVGNVPGHPANQTYCPGCGKVVIERDGFLVNAVRMRSGACEACGRPIPGVWS